MNIVLQCAFRLNTCFDQHIHMFRFARSEDQVSHIAYRWIAFSAFNFDTDGIREIAPIFNRKM